jgi:hypothetical protein
MLKKKVRPHMTKLSCFSAGIVPLKSCPSLDFEMMLTIKFYSAQSGGGGRGGGKGEGNTLKDA